MALPRHMPNDIIPGVQGYQKELYRARAIEMVAMSIRGMTIPEIAGHFDVCTKTVQRSLDWASREGLIKKYETDIVASLVPEAIKVYQEKLTVDRDAFVAKDVLDKLVKFGDRLAAREARQEEESLESYLDSLREKTIDGTVVRSEPTATQAGANAPIQLPAKAAAVDPPGTPGSGS